MKQPHISIVIPAYNEAHLIAKTLVSLDHYLSEADKPYELIVVDDGSRDDTVDVVKKFKDIVPNLSLIEHERNMGKGAAVRTGMLAAVGKYKLFLDADHSTSIDHLDQALPLLREYDVVIGSRAVEGAVLEVPQNWRKRTVGAFGNLLVRILLVPGIKDTQCGFKVFKGEVAQALFSNQRVDGWAFDMEILAISRQLRHKVREVPVRWVNGPKSRVRPWSYIEVFIDALRIRWWLWRNSHNLFK